MAVISAVPPLSGHGLSTLVHVRGNAWEEAGSATWHHRHVASSWIHSVGTGGSLCPSRRVGEALSLGHVHSHERGHAYAPLSSHACWKSHTLRSVGRCEVCAPVLLPLDQGDHQGLAPENLAVHLRHGGSCLLWGAVADEAEAYEA